MTNRETRGAGDDVGRELASLFDEIAAGPVNLALLRREGVQLGRRRIRRRRVVNGASALLSVTLVAAVATFWPGIPWPADRRPAIQQSAIQPVDPAPAAAQDSGTITAPASGARVTGCFDVKGRSALDPGRTLMVYSVFGDARAGNSSLETVNDWERPGRLDTWTTQVNGVWRALPKRPEVPVTVYLVSVPADRPNLVFPVELLPGDIRKSPLVSEYLQGSRVLAKVAITVNTASGRCADDGASHAGQIFVSSGIGESPDPASGFGEAWSSAPQH